MSGNSWEGRLCRFFLYSFNSQRSEYRQLREISWSGKASPFRTIVDEVAGHEWHARDARFLSLLGAEPPEEHRIFIPKPSDTKDVAGLRGYGDIHTTNSPSINCLDGDTLCYASSNSSLSVAAIRKPCTIAAAAKFLRWCEKRGSAGSIKSS